MEPGDRTVTDFPSDKEPHISVDKPDVAEIVFKGFVGYKMDHFPGYFDTQVVDVWMGGGVMDHVAARAESRFDFNGMAVAEKADMNSLTSRFVGLMATNRRLFALRAVIADYKDLLAGRRGETTAEVTSASKLTEKQLLAVRAALKKAVGTAVAVNAKVDPTLLGGLVVKVGSRMIDSSLRTKLQQLRLSMKGIG